MCVLRKFYVSNEYCFRFLKCPFIRIYDNIPTRQFSDATKFRNQRSRQYSDVTIFRCDNFPTTIFRCDNIPTTIFRRQFSDDNFPIPVWFFGEKYFFDFLHVSDNFPKQFFFQDFFFYFEKTLFISNVFTVSSFF